MSTVDKLALKIWDYHHVNHELEPADVILAMGSHDIRVAERGAQLYRQGLAPLIVFSGNRGRLTHGWTQSEATLFAARAESLGVPRDKMLLEDQSRNTGENVQFTRALLAEKGIAVQKIIVVQNPYMERRAYATMHKLWPEVEVLVTSPHVAFADYPTPEAPKDEMISLIVGDLQRIKVYAERGYQIPQDIPAEVWDAYEQLVKLGYTKYLVT